MQRMRSLNWNIAWALVPLAIAGLGWPARGDVIRPRSARTFPDVAGDMVGSQTYVFDPASRTGTFQVVNSPQFIALGPSGNQLVNVTPDQQGMLLQTLQLKLDQNGKLVETDDNRFELYGSVVIDNQVYRGLLLEGKPTAFGARPQKGAALSPSDVFDLNMKITGGKLAGNFGPEAYFRVVPQSNSTFQGNFATSFSGEKPLTNLRALEDMLPRDIPEPGSLVVYLTAGGGLWLAHWLRRGRCRRGRSGGTRGSRSFGKAA